MKSLAKAITKVFIKLFFRVELVNRDKIPSSGPALLCANHNTLLDMFFLGCNIDRWIYWMAKEELFRNPVSAYIMRGLGAFRVKRGTGDVSSVKSAYKLLEEGKIVGIFPHGTRIKPQNRKAAGIKSGAALIAANTGVPIIPAAVCGSYRVFSRMRVIYGDPFKIDKNDKKLTKEELAEISKDIIGKVNLLSEVAT